MKREIVCETERLLLVRSGDWEWVERKSGNGVAIVAVTADQKLILVEQMRAPLGRNVIEIPAGLVGDERQESAESAARRELEEETGYRAGPMAYLTSSPSSPGLTPEMIHFFRAGEVEKRSRGGGNASENEKIRIHEISIAELDDWLLRRSEEGALIDLKVYTGIYLLRSGRN